MTISGEGVGHSVGNSMFQEVFLHSSNTQAMDKLKNEEEKLAKEISYVVEPGVL